MKITLFSSLCLTASLTAFAQGKVNLINDAASLIVLSTDTSLVLAADRVLAGQPVGNMAPLPSGVTLVAGLYGGTSSSSLFLYSTVALTDAAMAAGYIPATHIVLNANAATGAPNIPGIPNGTPITAATPWFEVKVWDSAYPTFGQAIIGGGYVMLGAPFQMNPGPSISYPNTAPPGVNSTWTEGNIVMPIPEPSALALIGLGAAAVMRFRRRE